MSSVRSDYGDLAPPPRRNNNAVDGIIANTPSSVDDDVFVVVVGRDDAEQREGPCMWRAELADDGSPVLPVEGAECAVVFTDSNTPWIVGFDRRHTEAP